MAKWLRVLDLKSDLAIKESYLFYFFQSTQLVSKMYNVQVVTNSKDTHVYFCTFNTKFICKEESVAKTFLCH